MPPPLKKSKKQQTKQKCSFCNCSVSVPHFDEAKNESSSRVSSGGVLGNIQNTITIRQTFETGIHISLFLYITKQMLS